MGADSREAPLHVPSLDGYCPPVVRLGSLSMFSSHLTQEPDLTLHPTITHVPPIPGRYSLWGAGLHHGHLGWLCPWASPGHWQNTEEGRPRGARATQIQEPGDFRQETATMAEGDGMSVHDWHSLYFKGPLFKPKKMETPKSRL